MRNNKMCDNCASWEAHELGHKGTCFVNRKITSPCDAAGTRFTKWSDTCSKYTRLKKEVKNET